MVMSVPPIPPPGSNTDRPDANYRPARQKNVNPNDPPEGYYDASEPPLRTLSCVVFGRSLVPFAPRATLDESVVWASVRECHPTALGDCVSRRRGDSCC
jgi:hypothetical protein